MVQHVPDGSKEGTYIQTAVLTDGRFTVEYQDGDLQHHFHAEVENARRRTRSSWPGRSIAQDGGRCWPGGERNWASLAFSRFHAV
jgi:hypothetical protein